MIIFCLTSVHVFRSAWWLPHTCVPHVSNDLGVPWLLGLSLLASWMFGVNASRLLACSPLRVWAIVEIVHVVSILLRTA